MRGLRPHAATLARVVLEEEMSIKICLKLLRISPVSVMLFIINGRPWEISCELEMSSEGLSLTSFSHHIQATYSVSRHELFLIFDFSSYRFINR